MAASVKHQWLLSKYAKFIYVEEEDLVKEKNAEKQDIPCKGKWKVYTKNNEDLMLSYLESEHLLITHKDIILESISLLNSKMWLKGVAKKDSLLLLFKLKDGNNRRFRIQFDENEHNGCSNRKQCTKLLRKHFPICDYDDQPEKDENYSETVDINQMVLNKLQFRKAYAIDIPKDKLKEIIMLCLTDMTFPSYIAEIDEMLKSICK